MQANNEFSNAEKNLNMARSASIALAVVYIYNIIDVFLFHDYSKVSLLNRENKPGIQFYSDVKSFRDPISVSKIGNVFDFGIRINYKYNNFFIYKVQTG